MGCQAKEMGQPKRMPGWPLGIVIAKKGIVMPRTIIHGATGMSTTQFNEMILGASTSGALIGPAHLP